MPTNRFELCVIISQLMKALYYTKWCQNGTVADTIEFGEIKPPTSEPVQKQVLIEVKASAINVDDIAMIQDSAGGWFFHGPRLYKIKQVFLHLPLDGCLTSHSTTK